MKKIDYSKWYGSHVCPFCVKKLEKDDIRTEEVKISRGFGFYNRVKTSYCKECNSLSLIFQSPARIVFASIVTAIFMSGVLGGMLYILNAINDRVYESTDYTGIALISLGFSAAMIYIINRQNTRSKEIIQKIESRY